MKALQFQAIGQVNLVEIDLPRIGEDELLIKTGATTICTSDLNDIRENPFGIELPVVLGHEGAGTVVAVGNRVSSFRVGDRVAAHPVHPCGQCHNCRRGWGHLCASMAHFGLNRPGTFAQYFPVRAD
ncbi:MAG: alcohol dehydrogenase catalytic domain-containing protein, partial [Anaerolineae bacterium]|nr:alcohol dehydrogenase catalytic domain-containing protein [Anaerolineae bacterium]